MYSPKVGKELKVVSTLEFSAFLGLSIQNLYRMTKSLNFMII
jgi:hypothetical protein